jgi:ABC-type Fe3+-hydroxamate transport system substrate-binding protein
MKTKILAAVTLLAAGVLAGCNSGSDNAETSSGDIKKMVSDFSTDKIENKTASITSHELVVTDSSGKEKVYELPEKDFFVSIAPYEEQTHP